MTRLRRFLSDLALLPSIWRRLVREARAGGEANQVRIAMHVAIDAAIAAHDRAQVAYLARNLSQIQREARRYA